MEVLSKDNQHIFFIEVLIILICCVFIYFFSAKIDLLEIFVTFSHKHEDWELDEIIPVFIFLVFAISFLLYRKIILLKKALNEIKELKGLIAICSHCKNIRNDRGFWQQIELYIENNSNAKFSHGICPDCFEEIYPELMDDPVIKEELKKQRQTS